MEADCVSFDDTGATYVNCIDGDPREREREREREIRRRRISTSSPHRPPRLHLAGLFVPQTLWIRLFLNQVSNNCYTSLTVCITRFGSYVILLFQQVRGPVPLGGSICPQTRNAVDGGVQSSRLGIDVWDIPKANSYQ